MIRLYLLELFLFSPMSVNSILWRFFEKAFFFPSETMITGAQYSVRMLVIAWILVPASVAFFWLAFMRAFSGSMEGLLPVTGMIVFYLMVWVSCLCAWSYCIQIRKYVRYIRSQPMRIGSRIWRTILLLFFSGVICIMTGWVILIGIVAFEGIMLFWLIWGIYLLYVSKRNRLVASTQIKEVWVQNATSLAHYPIWMDIYARYLKIKSGDVLSKKEYASSVTIIVSILIFFMVNLYSVWTIFGSLAEKWLFFSIFFDGLNLLWWIAFLWIIYVLSKKRIADAGERYVWMQMVVGIIIFLACMYIIWQSFVTIPIVGLERMGLRRTIVLYSMMLCFFVLVSGILVLLPSISQKHTSTSDKKISNSTV